MANNQKLYCVLHGGLGNHLFQYAFAKSISLKTKRDLFFICNEFTIYKFLFGKEYVFNKKNHAPSYNNLINFLDLVDIKIKRASFLFHYFHFFLRILNYFKRKKFFNLNLSNFFSYEIIIENHHKFDYKVIEKIQNSNKKNIIINGYWQSEKYFYDINNLILSEIKSPKLLGNNFIDIHNAIKKKNSVALCIRIYEDIPGREKLQKIDENIMEGIAGLNYYKNAIKIIKEKIEKPVFFVFSQKFFPFLKEFDLGDDVYFINNDNNFKGTIENFFLMSECKNHIISYSSYYWWSALKAKKNNKTANILRPLSKTDKINKEVDYYPDDWEIVDW